MPTTEAAGGDDSCSPVSGWLLCVVVHCVLTLVCVCQTAGGECWGCSSTYSRLVPSVAVERGARAAWRPVH